MSLVSWKEAARQVRWSIQPFIDGRYVASEASGVLDNINPAIEEPLCRFSVGTAAEVDKAVSVARRRFAQGVWSEAPPSRRAEVLTRLADLMVRNQAELALLDSLEMGKPIRAALDDIEKFAAPYLKGWAGFATKLVGECAPLDSSTLMFNTYEPRGVVGAITPWNFPSVNVIYKIGPALAAGNTVVLKPSELSPSSALKIAELALEAGLPEGVLNIVPGLGSTVGAALASHPDVNMVSFTGSTGTGRKIMELCARSNGKPVLLECGGKSPQVVFDDVSDLDAVADGTAESLLRNSGQVCSAHTRLVVHERVREALLEKIIDRARQRVPGDPLDEKTTFGPLASPLQRDRVKAYIESGLRAGAHAVLQGPIRESGGCYVSPTIFDRVDANMSIVREEIFGPVLCVQAFSTDDEAIALANATEYGLTATVWTRDMGRVKRAAHAIRAGVVYVRTSGREGPDPGCMLSYEPQKATGFGSEVGLRGLQSYSTLKLVAVNGV